MVESENKRTQPINNYREKLLHYQLHVESHFDKFRVSFVASRFYNRIQYVKDMKIYRL